MKYEQISWYGGTRRRTEEERERRYKRQNREDGDK